jgi:hypothetical protein
MRPATDSALFAVCDPLDSDAASICTAKSDVSPAAATACGVNLRPELLVGSIGPVLGRLGWNSYGTERAQPVAKVRVAKRLKRLDLALNRCRSLPSAAVLIGW